MRRWHGAERPKVGRSCDTRKVPTAARAVDDNAKAGAWGGGVVPQGLLSGSDHHRRDACLA